VVGEGVEDFICPPPPVDQFETWPADRRTRPVAVVG
jgi:hypothetical protein